MSAAPAKTGNARTSTTTQSDINRQLSELEREADSALSPARRFVARGLPTVAAQLIALLCIGEATLSAWLGWETGSWPDTILVVEGVLAASIFLLFGVGTLLIARFAPRLITAPSARHALFAAAVSGDER